MADPSPLRQHAARIEAGRGEGVVAAYRHDPGAAVRAGVNPLPVILADAADIQVALARAARIAREVRDGG